MYLTVLFHTIVDMPYIHYVSLRKLYLITVGEFTFPFFRHSIL